MSCASEESCKGDKASGIAGQSHLDASAGNQKEDLPHFNGQIGDTDQGVLVSARQDRTINERLKLSTTWKLDRPVANHIAYATARKPCASHRRTGREGKHDSSENKLHGWCMCNVTLKKRHCRLPKKGVSRDRK